MPATAPPDRLPTTEQQALLRAAFLPPAEAIRIWKDLSAVTAVEDFQDRSHSLLPLVYNNLRVIGGADTPMGKLKGTYRYTWYTNASWLEALAGPLRALRHGGIDPLIRRDLALALRYYRRPGCRAIQTVDLQIQPGAAAAAMVLLERCGWTPVAPSPHHLLQSRTAGTFLHTSGRRLRLSWPLPGPDVDNDTVWAPSEAFAIGDGPVRAVGPTDALLDSCRLDAEGKGVSSAQRVADAATVIVTTGERVDWDRLVFRAREVDAVLPVREILNYVQLLQVPVPIAVLDTLRVMSPSTLDRLQYEAVPGQTNALYSCRLHWHQYRRLQRDTEHDAGPLGFPRYLQQVWGYQKGWQAGLHAGHAMARELQRVVSDRRTHRM